MYFSRIRFRRESVSAADLSRALLQDGYGAHQQIWRLFEAPERHCRDFLFRRDSEHSWPLFLAVSSTQPHDDRGVWSIDTKPYEPVVKTGDRFAFSLRANPVVTRWVGEGEKKRHARHDVVMDAKRRLDTEGVPKAQRPSIVELAQDQGFAWLENRAENCGFALNRNLVRVDGYRQLCIRKNGKKRPIRLSTLDFRGVLTVTSPERFRDTLFTGIGPAKGFGCGLMLVRRV